MWFSFYRESISFVYLPIFFSFSQHFWEFVYLTFIVMHDTFARLCFLHLFFRPPPHMKYQVTIIYEFRIVGYIHVNIVSDFLSNKMR